MQLLSQNATSIHYIVQPLDGLDALTVQRLNRLGIRPGSDLTVIRRYPFHGPVIIQIDQQRLALRDPIFQTLIGGD